jgi:diguanylate cyclase (GGDEF)-like protein
MENLNSAMEMISGQFAEGTTVWLVLFGVLIIAAVVYLCRGIYIFSKRVVESANFIILCVPVIAWALLIAAGSLLGLDNGEGTWPYVAIISVDLLIPSLLMLHIQSQVSYHPVTAAVRVAWLAVPAALIVLTMLKQIDPAYDFGSVYSNRFLLVPLAANIYLIVIIVKSYLLCFNVFYQMPKHMRHSTYQMLIAITVIAVAHGASTYFSASQNITHVLLAFAYIVALYTLCTAFFIANSSNVIVTSRDFVFSSLSTIVITVSLKGNILDWNKKAKDGCHPLPNPKYKEPYAAYRQRILDTCHGAVSPHDENILNIKTEGGEYYLLFTWHDISFLSRKFGYLVEIAEVTKSYSKLRYFEEIALYDNLTSMHNRNAYIECVKQIAAPENMPLLIAVGDVNNLKKTNDTLGHLYGDKLLLAITGAVKEKAPPNAFVARIGGDELVMLQPNADERDAITFIAGVTETLNAINDPDIGIPSISWGYSVMYDATENYNDVFRAADAIMYEAKRRAREISISGVVPQ